MLWNTERNTVPETLSERLVALAALLVAVALVALALSDRQERRTARVVAPAASTSAGPLPTLAAVPAVSPVADEAVSASRSPAVVQRAKLVLTASRGSCWVSIREDSPDGEVLFEGILESGRTIRFARDRIWLRLGAAANVDVTVNGTRARDLPGGTIDLVAARTGLAPPPA